VEVGLLMLVGGVATGVFGSLLGLGGGVLIVPLLTLAFGLDLREAVGVSLVCVIVTSGASASVYLQRNVANLRLGMLLELFTAIGAVVGGAVAFLLDERMIAGLFAVLLTYVAVTMLGRARTERSESRDPDGTTVDGIEPAPADDGSASNGSESDSQTLGRPTAVDRLSGPGYRIRHLRVGAVGSVFAGVVSALLGIGGGIVKVPVMHLVMGVPLRVSTATSNLMIGITASTSAIVYLVRGGIDPYVAGPTVVGVFLGATLGSRTAHRVDLRLLRVLFVAVLLYTAFEMARRALGIA
jgi:uncharacterized membrane protein YfcA